MNGQLHRLPRRTLLRAAASAAGLGISGLALPACGNSGSSGSANGGKGTTKLVNIEHDDRPLDKAAEKAMYDVFHKKHPKIDITFHIIPWEKAQSKMLTLGQGNSLPNCGRMAFPDAYAAAQIVLPLEDMVDDAWRSRYRQQALDAYSAQGSDGKRHLYGLPWFAGAHAVMVNKTLLDEVGIDLGNNWTTDDFTSICKELTIPGKQWGVAIDGNGIGDPVQIFLMACYAYGGKWVAGDPKSTEPEPLTFNSSETIAGITWYTNLYKKGYAVPSAPSDTYQQRDANFVSAKAAMAWQGPWNIVDTEKTFKHNGYELVSMPLPQGPAGSVNNYGGGAAGIFVSSKDQGVVDQAFEWIHFVASDKGERL